MAAPMKKKIDDIVAMLDAFMSGGGGHMNIRSDEERKCQRGYHHCKKRYHHEFPGLRSRESGLRRAHTVRGVWTAMRKTRKTVERISQTTINFYHYRRKRTWQIQTSATLRSITWFPVRRLRTGRRTPFKCQRIYPRDLTGRPEASGELSAADRARFRLRG